MPKDTNEVPMNFGKKALICGYYGNCNIGDEAMLAGMIHLLKSIDSTISIRVLSNDPDDTQKRHSVQAIHRRSQDAKIQRLIEFLTSHYFILGGGDLLRDSTEQSISQMWLQYLQKAILLKKKTLVLGISVGDIWRSESRSLIPKCLNQVDLIAVRDRDSKSRLKELGVSKAIRVMSDLALHALPTNCQFASTRQPLQVGISIRPLRGRGRIDPKIYRNLQQELAGVTDFLIEHCGAIVHFLPFQTFQYGSHPNDDDYLSITELIKYSQHHNNYINGDNETSYNVGKIVVHRYFNSVQEMLQLMSQFRLMIGTRLHSLILAAGLGIPIIAAEYDPKVQGFMKEIGQSDRSIGLQQFNRDSVVPQIIQILSEPYFSHQEIIKGIEQYRNRTDDFQTEFSDLLLGAKTIRHKNNTPSKVIN